jgi:hypothetical protein
VKSSRRRIRCAAGSMDRRGRIGVSGGQLGPALAAPSGEDRSSCAGPHAQPEAVGPGTTAIVRLEGALAHDTDSTGRRQGHEKGTTGQRAGAPDRRTADHTRKRAEQGLDLPTVRGGPFLGQTSAGCIASGLASRLARGNENTAERGLMEQPETGSCGHSVEGGAAPSLGSARRLPPSPVAVRPRAFRLDLHSLWTTVWTAVPEAPDKHAYVRATDRFRMLRSPPPDCPTAGSRTGRAGREHVCDGVVGVPAGPVG